MTITTYLRSLAIRLLFWFLARLPNKSKRMVFIVSLTQRFGVKEQIDPSTLAKLNKVLSIGASESSMWIPAQLAQIIWHDRSVKTICNTPTPQYAVLTQESIHELCQAVVQGDQKCLQYAPPEVILKDVNALLKGAQLFELRTQAQPV